MTTPKFSEIQRLGEDQLAGLPALNVAVLRNIVLDPIAPYLRYFAWQEGFRASCRFGEYDNVVQEAVGGVPELLNAETDCVLVFLRLDTLSAGLSRGFAGLSAGQVRAEVERIRALVGDVLAGIRRQTAAMILWHGFELPLHPALGVLDAQLADGQGAVVHQLNQLVREALAGHRNAYFVDLNRSLARVGAGAFYDGRYWHAAKAPYTLEALRDIATEVMKYLRALKGRSRKVLVLDCDGTLWGGVVGEEGLAGIALGTTSPGSPFYELQQEILNLHHRGVVLALCSKNEAADVWEVFEQHPDMVLKRNHIAAHRINWTDKASNLREIAAELNLGLDSLVLVDDSEFEIGLVREALPQVATLHLPAGKATEYRALLAGCGLFDTLTLSAEDRARGAAYQAEAGRRELQASSADMPSYLRSLGMKLEIRLADDFAIPRVAQLTQKTNQFNLTTRRYSEEDIQRLAAGPASAVLYLRYSDRFGDAGIVGVCVLRYEGAQVTFDSLLLSCRILGRGVEDAFLAQCLTRARLRGARTALAAYRPTPKTAQVKDFYAARGFQPSGQTEQGTDYRMDLAAWHSAAGDYFQVESGVAAGIEGGVTA